LALEYITLDEVPMLVETVKVNRNGQCDGTIALIVQQDRVKGTQDPYGAFVRGL
jgi:hypothetical protein